MSVSDLTITVHGPSRDQVGESPLWHPGEQALYWVDIDGCQLRRLDGNGHVRTWALPERTGCIARHAGGGLLAAMVSGLYHLRVGADDTLSHHQLAAAPYGVAKAPMRFNDGRTDRAGRFWVSSMVMNMSLARPAGVLYRFDHRGLVPMVSGLITGNGLGFSPDGRTLYLSDSHPSVQCIWAFDLDSDGALSSRRVFADMRDLPGRPDGAAVDELGGYWICGNDAGQVHRFTPNGRLDRSLAVPVAKPAMCAFGGPDLATLYVTSITPGQPMAGFDASLAGALLSLRPGERGLPDVPFHPHQP